MSSRSNFVKGEIEEICKLLKVSFEYADHAFLEDEKRFVKIFELLMEISDKSNLLQQVVKGTYLIM